MKKKITSVILMLALVLSLAACGSKKEEEKAKIVVAIEATGDIPQAFQEQIDRFNQTSQKAEVEIITYAGAEAYETAIMGQVAGKTAPDIILLDGGKKIQEYAKQGVITPLDDYLGDIKGNFETGLIEACMYDGKLYGITKDYNTTVLFYQKDMLEDAGLTIPETLDEFKADVEALTTDSVAGFGCDPKLNYLYPFAVAMGADFVGADGTIDEAKLTSQEHKEMLQMFKDMFDNGQATSPYIANAGWDGELFGNQKAAFLYAGSWVTGVIEDTSKAGVAALPKGNTSASMLYTTGWCITQQCENKEAAAELIRFLSTDDELVEGNILGTIGLPPTKGAMEKLIAKKADDPFLPVYQEVVKDGIAFGLIDSKFVDVYNKAFEDMIYNGASVEDTIDKMAAGIE